MKRNSFSLKFRLTPCLTVVLAGALQAAPPNLREVINFNREWKFQLGDPTNAAAVAFDAAAWESVGLPHSFSIPYFASPKFYVGYGWYRKHHRAVEWHGKRVNLEFDGAFQVAEVFINGNRIGEHKGGYTGFTFDITDVLKPGNNVVAVRVNNLWDARLALEPASMFFRRHLPGREVGCHRASPCRVVWRFCHDPPGVERIRHRECEDRNREQLRHGQVRDGTSRLFLTLKERKRPVWNQPKSLGRIRQRTSTKPAR